MWRKAHERGIHGRRRMKRRRLDDEQQLGIGEQLCLNREVSVFAMARRGREPLRHLLLHQEGRAAQNISEAQHSLDQRRRHIIRQIAGDRGRTPARQADLERISLDNLETRLMGECPPEMVREVRIQLDRDNSVRAREKVARQRAAAGADFDDQILMLPACSLRNTAQN